MPLTKTGKETLKNFEDEYGKKKGKEVFYAWLNEKTKSERRKFERLR